MPLARMNGPWRVDSQRACEFKSKRSEQRGPNETGTEKPAISPSSPARGGPQYHMERMEMTPTTSLRAQVAFKDHHAHPSHASIHKKVLMRSKVSDLIHTSIIKSDQRGLNNCFPAHAATTF